MQVHKRKEGAVMLVRPSGPVIVDEMDELDRTLDELQRNWERRVLVNLEDVTFMDSAALEMLLKHVRGHEEYGLKIKFCGLNETNQKILEITRLEGRFDVYPDVAMAIKSYL